MGIGQTSLAPAAQHYGAGCDSCITQHAHQGEVERAAVGRALLLQFLGRNAVESVVLVPGIIGQQQVAELLGLLLDSKSIQLEVGLFLSQRVVHVEVLSEVLIAQHHLVDVLPCALEVLVVAAADADRTQVVLHLGHEVIDAPDVVVVLDCRQLFSFEMIDGGCTGQQSTGQNRLEGVVLARAGDRSAPMHRGVEVEPFGDGDGVFGEEHGHGALGIPVGDGIDVGALTLELVFDHRADLDVRDRELHLAIVFVHALLALEVSGEFRAHHLAVLQVVGRTLDARDTVAIRRTLRIVEHYRHIGSRSALGLEDLHTLLHAIDHPEVVGHEIKLHVGIAV